ncbi:nucleotidyltransferase family protein [Chryseobacterium sp. SC28]|uniref:nucleotidyltransferase family protein n=1 Tax=Chryseobacterium sp. SC28 TaxID=2268028 RepID=UPI001E389343|nr:nucleotidyltransferase domain-containing protein [Chryseobacterium sp. SC28]
MENCRLAGQISKYFWIKLISYFCSMRDLILDKKHIDALCQEHKVENLYLFGSVLSENYNDSSDIDILVKFSPMDLYDYFDNYLSLKDALSQYFGKEVDLVEVQALKNPILIQSINTNKYQIYGRKNPEILV